MRWTALPVIVAALLSTARAAEPPPVDEEFLEYLASLEDSEDNWTVVAGDKVASQPTSAKPTPVSQPQTTPRSTSTPASAPTPAAKKPEPKS